MRDLAALVVREERLGRGRARELPLLEPSRRSPPRSGARGSPRAWRPGRARAAGRSPSVHGQLGERVVDRGRVERTAASPPRPALRSCRSRACAASTRAGRRAPAPREDVRRAAVGAREERSSSRVELVQQRLGAAPGGVRAGGRSRRAASGLLLPQPRGPAPAVAAPRLAHVGLQPVGQLGLRRASRASAARRAGRRRSRRGRRSAAARAGRGRAACARAAPGGRSRTGCRTRRRPARRPTRTRRGRGRRRRPGPARCRRASSSSTSAATSSTSARSPPAAEQRATAPPGVGRSPAGARTGRARGGGARRATRRRSGRRSPRARRGCRPASPRSRSKIGGQRLERRAGPRSYGSETVTSALRARWPASRSRRARAR